VNLLTEMRPLIGRGLSAAVYTQTTDVEIEVNGLMTYDREVVKMDEKRITEAARKLYLPPPRMRTLVETSEKTPQDWHYTTEKPADGWQESDFDDGAWKHGEGGFGTEGTPGALVRTVWDTPDIWLRRTFELGELPANGEIMLSIHHDENAEVYINGKLVRSLRGYTTSYRPVALGEDASEALRVGKNVIAIHCHQTGGGQYIDVGVLESVERGGWAAGGTP
jgi:hypothetical protein